jgi:hypothetical protein
VRANAKAVGRRWWSQSSTRRPLERDELVRVTVRFRGVADGKPSRELGEAVHGEYPDRLDAERMAEGQPADRATVWDPANEPDELAPPALRGERGHGWS